MMRDGDLSMLHPYKWHTFSFVEARKKEDLEIGDESNLVTTCSVLLGGQAAPDYMNNHVKIVKYRILLFFFSWSRLHPHHSSYWTVLFLVLISGVKQIILLKHQEIKNWQKKKKEWQTFLPSWPSEQQGKTVTSTASQMFFKLTVTNGQQKQGMEI